MKRYGFKCDHASLCYDSSIMKLIDLNCKQKKRMPEYME